MTHGLEARCAELAAQVAELQQTFDLQWEADMRAVKMWREAHPGNDLVLPDRANMVVWLLEQHDARAQGRQEPQTLGGMIAAIYGDLDAEDCRIIDRAWIEWRGRGTITSSLSSTTRCRFCDEVVEPGHDCSAPSTVRTEAT